MFTENYILMCEKGKEIQKEKKNFDNGDWLYYLDNKIIELVYIPNSMRGMAQHRFDDFQIWLPTQEQLMEMIYRIIGLGKTHLYGVMQEILKFLGQEYKDNCIPDEYFTTEIGKENNGKLHRNSL